MVVFVTKDINTWPDIFARYVVCARIGIVFALILRVATALQFSDVCSSYVVSGQVPSTFVESGSIESILIKSCAVISLSVDPSDVESAPVVPLAVVPLVAVTQTVLDSTHYG